MINTVEICNQNNNRNLGANKR